MESITNRLESMDSEVPTSLQVANLLASFGNKEKSPFSSVVSALQTLNDKDLTWDSAKCRLLQEYESMQSLKYKNKKTLLRTKHFLGERKYPVLNAERKATSSVTVGVIMASTRTDTEKNHNPRNRHKFLKYEEPRDENAMKARTTTRNFIGRFIVDSGASQHMVHKKSILSNFTNFANTYENTVIIGDGRKLRSLGYGSAIIQSNSKEPKTGIVLTKVLYVPHLDKNLISCDALSRDGYSTTFANGSCTVAKDFEIIQSIQVRNDLYKIAVYSGTTEYGRSVQAKKIFNS